jgi:hypothetical protein
MLRLKYCNKSQLNYLFVAQNRCVGSWKYLDY